MSNEVEIQAQHASGLRALAIKFLRHSDHVVAKSFRGEYLASGLGSYNAFLNEQAKDKTWGTYIEATALGAALNKNVVVTPIKDGTKQDPICLYRAENQNEDTIHLFNRNNTHWFINEKTLGDGNCLYNAFAQSLQGRTKQPTLFQHDAEIIAHQKSIEQSISSQSPPSTLKADLEKEKARISGLEPKEQEQIANDYKLALKLASTASVTNPIRTSPYGQQSLSVDSTDTHQPPRMAC
jgi:hypothetical protein